MFKRMTMVGLAVVAAAALAMPAALAQEGSATQVTYGDDVYGGTEGGTTSQPASGSGSWTQLAARLTGVAEVPDADPDGSGTALVKVRGNQVCYDVRWSGTDAVASHIHKGRAGQNGDVVVPFFAAESPLEGTRKTGCATVDTAVAAAIAKNPSWYYVNVHSPDFPKGAVRGQLAMASAATAGSLPYTGASRSKGLLLLGLCVAGAGSMLLAVGQRRRSAAAVARH
jgi:LPXTG-motif cell wall-anchored protein